jgi:hypothetical protein
MFKIATFSVLFFFLMLSAQAKDLSAQQAGFNNALRKMEKAEEVYKIDAQAVVDTEKAIEKKKQQLVEEQKKAELSKKNYLEAKEKLEVAQEVLDRAWKE